LRVFSRAEKWTDIEMTRGYSPLLASNILEILFLTGAGVYGGVIYRLQLAAIQH
jgi:hypothetical protein